MTRRLALILSCCITLAACQPPASDNISGRGVPSKTYNGPSKPVIAPDTSDAIWAISKKSKRLLYGNPGDPPVLTITCVGKKSARPTIRITRFAQADARATAFMAVVGDKRTARLPVDAAKAGNKWLWQGEYPAAEPQLDVLAAPSNRPGTNPSEGNGSGAKVAEEDQTTLTIPGAGTLRLKPSALPPYYIEACRRGIIIKVQPGDGNKEGAARSKAAALDAQATPPVDVTEQGEENASRGAASPPALPAPG